MTHGNPNLTPTVIADKNGKITTVHKRDAKSAASSMSSVPAPALGYRRETKVSMVSRYRGIATIISKGSSSEKAIKAKTDRFLASSTPEQLDILDEAISGFDSATDHERLILSTILEPLSIRTGKTGAIHELVAHRAAFASEWSINNKPRRYMHGLEPFMFGVRQQGTDFSTKLDCTDESAVGEQTALIRFAYELKERAPFGGFQPVYNVKVEVDHDSTGYVYASAHAYENDELKNLIIENADRVDDLIEFSVTQETSDPHRLRALLEHEGHSSMTYGLL
jgi:hypothetical protein